MGKSDQQWQFLKDVAILIQFADGQGMKLTGGNLYRTDEQNEAVGGTSDSKHKDRMAIDLNLFIDGGFQTSTESHRLLGEFWESIRPENSWGGRFHDGNHYSRGER
jgi:hypothetical protein